MIDYLNRIITYFPFFLSFFVIVIVLAVILDNILKKTKNNIKIFGLFMGLNNNNILSLTFITTSYIFFIWQLFSKSIDMVTLGVIVTCFVLTDIISKHYIRIIFSIISSILLYLGLYCKCVFYDYITTIHSSVSSIILLILLILFLFFYISYILIKKADYIVVQNKYIKKFNGKHS